MMRLETLGRFKVPIVWTLHDSWPFTGGCFLPGDCTRYQEACGKCPILNSSREDDLSRRVWQRKKKAWHDLDLTLIAPSRWMADRTRASSLFENNEVVVIPNGIDVEQFKPADKTTARKHFSLPQDKNLILFGAKAATKDKNKGFDLLVQALHETAGIKWRDEIELVVFGSTRPDTPLDLGLKVHFMGWQNDNAALTRLYSAADVYVLPSIQENLPFTIMEAMACGTPCVAFRQGGVPDLIDHQQNGYLAQPYDPKDLCQGILRVLGDKERRRKMAAESRRKVIEKFAIDKVTVQHMALYRELLQ
jgi:glycosyltransferase involved in cell wall biosynthesis